MQAVSDTIKDLLKNDSTTKKYLISFYGEA